MSYTELGLALTAFNVVSAVLQTPAGFLVDRIGARINLIGGLLLGAGAIAVAGARRFVLGVHRHVRACSASPTPSITRPTTRCCPSTSRRQRMTQVFSFHTCSGMIGSAMAPATLLVHAGPGGLARRVPLRGRCSASSLRCSSSCSRSSAARPLPHAAKPRDDRAGERAGRRPGGSLLSAPILLNLVFFVVLSMVGGGLNQYLVVGLGRCTARRRRSPIPRSPACSP